jgi:hypothetical protein
MNVSSMSPSFTNLSYPSRVYRTTHEELVRTHTRLVLTFTDVQTTKMKSGDDDDSTGISFSTVLSDKASGTTPRLSPLDYPLVKYWERKVWKSVIDTRKDTSEVQTKGGSRGGTRSSKGENVMMSYIEDSNGNPVDGNTASGIREFARTIWRSLYDRGIAPETWGQATKDVRDEYCREMESEYPVLRFCSNHWKANALATAVYSQWYRTYDRKMKPSEDNNNNGNGDNSDGNNSDNDAGDGSDGPPRKKSRTTTIVDDDTLFTPPEPEALVDNERTSVNAILTEASSHHGTALKDPL